MPEFMLFYWDRGTAASKQIKIYMTKRIKNEKSNLWLWCYC